MKTFTSFLFAATVLWCHAASSPEQNTPNSLAQEFLKQAQNDPDLKILLKGIETKNRVSFLSSFFRDIPFHYKTMESIRFEENIYEPFLIFFLQTPKNLIPRFFSQHTATFTGSVIGTKRKLNYYAVANKKNIIILCDLNRNVDLQNNTYVLKTKQMIEKTIEEDAKNKTSSSI